ncbi:GNAT family N-acetyltransferase [Novosphingobium sp. FSW06-99]|uniref:GNAT family N-acetyltransferase n=1 Tax=Novosphingobium sp. FSW06-99 TaxID=1739113 RepID=UPI000B0F0A4E|nr:GNAT family N-acetyltransferase [Novosphingobium sp. FSW06-99]
MRDQWDDALDRPVWAALTGPQAALALGGPSAWRIDPGYGPFAAAAPGQEAALAGLLANADDELWLVEGHAITAPPGTVVSKVAHLAQMLATGPVDAGADDEFVALGQADVPAMTELALATRPGPWGPSTWRYGPFYGVRRGGRLIAMAGERMRPAAGVVEVSGVCTDPAWRGQGLAGRLIRHVMAGHRARGQASFLHSYADNAGAIALYRSLGFEMRGQRVVTILGKAR